MKELVTITAPKKIERVVTDGLSQTEVRSRLKALANTIDSRGWAVKNVNVNAFTQPDPFAALPSDRLIDPGNIPQEVPNYDVQAADDMLDEVSNPIAQQFDQMINRSSQAHRQHIVDQLNSTAPAPAQTQPADYWFMHQAAAPANLPADQAMFSGAQLVAPKSDQGGEPVIAKADPAEAELSAELKSRHAAGPSSYSHLRTLKPAAPAGNDAASAALPPLTAAPDPAILSLANNNDLNVATLAREASKAKGEDEPPQDEVVISLR